MHRALSVTVLSLAGLAACQPSDGVWFRGDFDAAKAVAAERNTLVMLDFYTDWCSWCRRLSEDTFPDPVVQTELAELVAMKVNAEKGGEELAEAYAVDGYPTIVFVNSDGVEVDRIVGFLPPERFAAQVRRIRTGDTFAACLKRLDENPGDLEALERSVEGLLERSDVSGAIHRLEAFDEASPEHGSDTCRRLTFRARAELHSALYAKMSKVYRTDADHLPEIPATVGTARLHELVTGPYLTLGGDEQAAELRAARSADAGDVLAIVGDLELEAPARLEAGHFAYFGGHREAATTFYRSWFEAAGAEADAGDLNIVAWRLYLMGGTPELAVEVARAAHARDDSPDVTDTLARALYSSGATDEAITLQTAAAEAAEGKGNEDLAEAARRMRAGEDLGDQPAFELYPGTREG